MAFRLIDDGPADGPWNMAVDEALLETCAGSVTAPATVRLYAWRRATLSLGRSQPAGTSCDPLYLRQAGIDLVRRPSGGAAVLHEHERTYAVTARLRQDPFCDGLVEAFRRVAGALAAALRELGLEGVESADAAPTVPHGERGAACFGSAARHEITWRGLKLVGSAQLRRGGAFLQHGSIPIRADARRLSHAVGAVGTVGGFTDLETALGGALSPQRLDRALVSGFERVLGQPAEPGRLSAEEEGRATRLADLKYRADSWTWGGQWAGEPRR